MNAVIWIQLIVSVAGVVSTAIVAYFQYKSKQEITGMKTATVENTVITADTFAAVAENTALTQEVHAGVMGSRESVATDKAITQTVERLANGRSEKKP